MTTYLALAKNFAAKRESCPHFDRTCFISSKRRVPLSVDSSIVVLDEMDHLPRALETIANLSAAHTSLKIIGIANTHTLMISEFESIETLHFAPYTSSQLIEIAQSRLGSLTPAEMAQVVSPTGLKLLSTKLATRTGDARSLLAVLCAAISSAGVAAVAVGPSHVLAALRTHAPTSGSSKAPLSSETAAKLADISIHARLALMALLLPGTSSSMEQDTTTLHKTYTTLRGPTAPLSRPEFLDVLSGLEVRGVVQISSPASSPDSSPVKRRVLKRTMSMSKSAGGSVSLSAMLDRDEVLRALGLSDIDGTTALDIGSEESRRVWKAEVARRARIAANISTGKRRVSGSFEGSYEN